MGKLLQDADLIKLLERLDEELAAEAQAGGCRYCKNKLHCADYERKPRGAGCWDSRHSYCCAQCRRRTTPVSVRFLGRRVYTGIVVVLMAAMTQGMTRVRVELLRRELRIDVRTLKRWREWWLGEFVKSPFWKGGRAMFTPVLKEGEMPLSLVNVFDAGSREGLVKLMRFLAPITVSGAKGGQAMQGLQEFPQRMPGDRGKWMG